jgi:branched-chain amino acid transport system substrate-binding protein
LADHIGSTEHFCDDGQLYGINPNSRAKQAGHTQGGFNVKVESRVRKAKQAGNVDRQRRRLVKLIAASGASAIASPWTFQSSRAAAKTIKIGMITPETGPIAAFGEPSKWVAEEVSKFLGDGIMVAGDKYPVQILNRDSQSNPNRASDVAADLINNDKVDIMIASSTSDTTNPVADQCELNGVPCITSDDPWQAWFFGRKGDPKKGFDWTYHFFWGFDMVANMFAEMWLTLPTNKIAGVMLTNDPDGIAASDPVHGLPATVKSHGFDVHYLGLYPPLTDDFTAQITQLKNMNADIACGIFNPPQFAIFWTQCAQQSFRPKIVTPPKALLFPTAVEALGDRGAGMSTEVWWSHHHPFKSSLTGQTAQQYCDAYEKASGKQWTQPLGLQARQPRGCDRRAQAREETRRRLDPRRQSPRPTTNRSSVRSPGRAVRPIRCRTSARRRSSAGSGKRARSGSTI